MASLISCQIPNMLYSKSCRQGINSISLRFDDKMSWGVAVASSKKSHSICNLLDLERKLYIHPAACSGVTNSQLSAVSNIEFSNVNYLVRVLHECARSFTLAVQSLDFINKDAEVTMAWIGVDVHVWHKNIAHQVAVYALLKSLVAECGSQVISILEKHIKCQIALRDLELLHWFRVYELPCLSDYFAPSIKTWLAKYRERGVAGASVAITCCVAIECLGSAYHSTSAFKFWLDDSTSQLFSLTECHVRVGKMYDLAVKAGFENAFLSHFGANIMSSELEFWIELAQSKLSAAFRREGLRLNTTKRFHFQDKVQENSLAVLGLFAYLGRSSRIFLAEMGMKDLEETNLLSYMECGSIFIYPDLSSLAVYQYFMEVVTDELGWLHFYGFGSPLSCRESPEKRKCKHQTRQTEKEIGLCNVLTTCSDFFLGFGQFYRSKQLPMDSNLLTFLVRGYIHLLTVECDLLFFSQQLLSVCRKDYEKSGLGQFESKAFHESLLKKFVIGAFAISCNVWMGTRLLLIDMKFSAVILLKLLQGHKITYMQMMKLKRTALDIAYLVPVTILMLLPVSAVGHAAILAGIKKYIPFLIPSPYTRERLDVVKQLNRSKQLKGVKLSAEQNRK